MPIYVSPAADLLAMLSVAAADTFGIADLQYATPHVTTAGEKTTYNRNTKLTVGFTPVSVKGTGYKPIYYDRLELSVLGQYDYGLMALAEGQTLTELIPLLKKYTGAVFTTDDLESTTVTKNSQTGVVTVTLTAKANSLGWVGSYTFTQNPPPHISTAFPDDRLDGF